MRLRRSRWGRAGGGEFRRKNSVPATREVIWKDLFTVPLARPAAVEWHAASKVAAGVVTIDAAVKDAAAKKVEYQLNDAKYAPMEKDENGIWSSSIPTPELTPGEQR